MCPDIFDIMEFLIVSLELRGSLSYEASSPRMLLRSRFLILAKTSSIGMTLYAAAAEKTVGAFSERFCLFLRFNLFKFRIKT